MISVLPEFLAAPTGRKLVEKEEISTSLTSLRSKEMEVEAKMKMRMKMEVEVKGPRPDRGAACVERRIWRGGKVSTVTTPTVTTSRS